MTATTVRSIINVSHVTSAESLHEILAAALDFPMWYGKNWDAFEECIRDPDQSSMPNELIIKGWESLAERLPREATVLRECLTDLKDERPEVLIKWEPID